MAESRAQSLLYTLLGLNRTGQAMYLVVVALGVLSLGMWQTELARWRFSEADKIMDAHPRRMVRTPRVMSEAYKSILSGLVARGWARPREPVRLSKSRIAMIVLRHFII